MKRFASACAMLFLYLVKGEVRIYSLPLPGGSGTFSVDSRYHKFHTQMLPPPAARSALRQLLYVPGPVGPSSRCHAGGYHSLFQTVPHPSVARDYCASASAADRVSYKQPTCRSTWQRKSAWHRAGFTPTRTWTWPNGAHSPGLVLLLLYPPSQRVLLGSGFVFAA